MVRWAKCSTEPLRAEERLHHVLFFWQTNQLQPLDKYFNQQMKNFLKTLYNRVVLDEMEINMAERNSIIKLVALVFDQMCAPVFRKMVQYS